MDRYLIASSLTPSTECAVEFVLGELVESDTEAIANAANAMLLGGGGVDGAIHRAAGHEQLQGALREVKERLPGGVLETGGAVLTPGFSLKARHVIHCVGPIYEREGARRAAELLASCYATALALCRTHRIGSIAFPSISTGIYGYPVEEAAPVALGAVWEDLRAHGAPGLCRFVLRDEATLQAYRDAALRLSAL